MITRREAIGLLGSMSAGSLLARTPMGLTGLFGDVSDGSPVQSGGVPPLAPGTPSSPERMALINAFKQKADDIDKLFVARSHKSDWVMPYRLFRPQSSAKLPLVLFLHGSGGLGTDNQKQMGLGNIFGTRVWVLPDNQKRFPCYVVAPQTDRGWVKYGDPAPGDSVARVVPGLGDGARMAFDVIDALCHEFPVDTARMYLTGQSMGGAGAWHMLVERPGLFAAAAICCGSASVDNTAVATHTPLWNFHGDADTTVSITVSRDRIATLRKAGGHPLSTEYAGVVHNSWEWAYTEPALPGWLFSNRRAG